MISDPNQSGQTLSVAMSDPVLGSDIPEPDAVTGLSDVRLAIDTIDAQIVALLGHRLDYVKAAADFKEDLQSVPAPDRVRTMLDDRARWAETAGLSPDFIGPLFALISEWFIRQQMSHWPHRNVRSPSKDTAQVEPDPT